MRDSGPRVWTTSSASSAGPALLAIVAAYASYSIYRLTRGPTTTPSAANAGPTTTTTTGSGKGTRGGAGGAERVDLPYPPDAFPGAREVETSYGRIKVYEWGLEDGDKVLLVHGMSTPSIALGDVARELVQRGCRVMMFDLFGRGHSEAPADLPFDERLYDTQILHVLASSDLCWTGPGAFHILGYSLGGALVTAFAAHHHGMLRSITCVCPAGIMRDFKLDFAHRLFVDWEGWIPKWLLAAVLRRRLEPMMPELPPARQQPEQQLLREKPRQQQDPEEEEEQQQQHQQHQQQHVPWDLVPCSADHAFPRVGDVIQWQLENNAAYLFAYMDSFRQAPVYGQHEKAWKRLGERMAANRVRGRGLQKMCLILGDQDPILPRDWCVEDAHRLMGVDGVEIHVLAGTHAVPMTRGREVAELTARSWREEE